jgi:hypothetical protein
MYKYIFVFIFCVYYSCLHAQSWTAKNALSVDFGDIYQLNYSVNYSRILFHKNIVTFAASAGISVEPIDYTRLWQPLFPVEATLFVGNGKHHLEGGILLIPGLYYDYYMHTDYLVSNEPNKVITKKAIGTTAGFRMGYRFQKPGGGFFFRLGFTPIFYSSFTPFFLTYIDAGQDGCPLCIYSEPTGKKAGFVPGVNVSLGRSF